MGFKTVRVIRLNDQVSLINNDDLNVYTASTITGLSSIGTSATVNQISSIGDVTINSACEGNSIVYRCGAWVNETITVSAGTVVPDYPCSTANYGLTYSGCGGLMWKKLKEQDHYISFDANLVLSPTSLEKGRTLAGVSMTITNCNTADYTLAGYTALKLNGALVSAADLGGVFPTITFTPPGGITESAGFTITVEASEDTSNEAAGLTWYWKKYWGVNSATTITASDILALSSQALASTKAGTLSYNAAGGKYLWVAWPVTFGSRTAFTVGGLETTFNEVTVSVTNAYSANANYYLYRSQETQFGTAISLVVT